MTGLDIAPRGLWRQIEDPTLRKRPAQCQILGMRPDQGHRRPGRTAEEQLLFDHISRIPDLLRDQSACVGERGHGGKQSFRLDHPARRQFVVRPLADQQGPAPSNALAVESRAVGVLAVPIVGVAVPDGSAGRLHLQQSIDHRDGVDDARVVRRAQPEPHERQSVGADDLRGWFPALTGGPVLDRHESFSGRGAIGNLWRGDAHVVALHTALMGEGRARHVRPALDSVVPGVCRFSEVSRQGRFAGQIGQVGRGQQGRHRCGECERGVARVFFPTVLQGHRPIRDQVHGRPAHHRPPFRLDRAGQGAFAVRQLHQ